MSPSDYQNGRLMDAMLIFLKIINALVICYAGYLLTIRVYPRLYTSSDVTGQDYIKELQKISDNLSDADIRDPDSQKLKDQIIEALSLISNSFIDNKNAVEDANKRTKKGIILLVIGAFAQSVFILFS